MGKLPEERILPPFKRAVTDSPVQETSVQAVTANEYQFFGLAHNQANPIGFKIIFAGGNIAAIQYHDIISPLTYDGQSTIELLTPALSIKIIGKNLGVLFDLLFENRVAWMKEPDSSFIQEARDQPEIEAIKMECKE